jgi:hypothetical protein
MVSYSVPQIHPPSFFTAKKGRPQRFFHGLLGDLRFFAVKKSTLKKPCDKSDGPVRDFQAVRKLTSKVGCTSRKG